MLFEERTIKKDVIYKGKVLSLELHEVETGGRHYQREIVRHQGAVAVLCLEKDKVLLIKQYRKSVDGVLLEIPAGKIERGEKPSVTAARELEEETGFTAEKMTELYTFFVAPGFCDEKVTLFLAEGLKHQALLKPDEDEMIENVWMSISKIKDALKSGSIKDAKTIIALQQVLLNYNNSK